MRVTAVLRVPGEWQTLMAWRLDDSGKEIWMWNLSPAVATTWLVVATLIIVLVGAAVVLAALDSKQPAMGVGLGAFGLALFAWKALSDSYNARAIAMLLRAGPPMPQK